MALHGVIAILVGIAFIFATQELISTIVQVFGFAMLISGGIITARSLIKNKQNINSYKYLAIFQGILLITLGLFTTFYSDEMVKLIILFFGIWAVISGGFQAFYGIKTKNEIKGNNILSINGLILLIIGFVMIFKHDIFLDFMGLIIGWLSLVIGFVSLFFALLFHKMKNSFKDADIVE